MCVRRSHRITPLVVPTELHRADPRLLSTTGMMRPAGHEKQSLLQAKAHYFPTVSPTPVRPVDNRFLPVEPGCRGRFVPNSSTGCARGRPHAGGFRRDSPRALLWTWWVSLPSTRRNGRAEPAADAPRACCPGSISSGRSGPATSRPGGSRSPSRISSRPASTCAWASGPCASVQLPAGDRLGRAQAQGLRPRRDRPAWSRRN